MQKIQDIIKPYLSIIFGVILLLGYMNYLSYDGAVVTIGIFALIFGVYYIMAGLFDVLLGEKMPAEARRIIEMLSISFLGLFIFIRTLIYLVELGEQFGPSGWIIAIYSLIISVFFVSIVPTVYFIKNELLSKVAKLSAALFVLVLLLAVLFDTFGNTTVLGAVNLIDVILYIFFAMILFSSAVVRKE